MPLFSFLLPTRGRPEFVERLFHSILATTSNPRELEIVLALDADDLASQEISNDHLLIKKVILPRGSTMGVLNNACFDASEGRFLMIMNDDILLRTKHWDDFVVSAFSRFRDDIALIHTNDLLFRERLCTFPIVSRKACLEIGLCPSEYRKYKIDDHIYDIYNLLGFLGHKRIVYLPEVIFEHDNHDNHEGNLDDQNRHIYHSLDDKVYTPKKAIIEEDDRIFLNKISERKQAALQLASLIDGERFALLKNRKQSGYGKTLEPITDPYSYRSPNLITTLSPKAVSTQPPRTTIVVVTSDIQNDHAAECISRIKKHTSNYDLLVLDNGKRKDFSHPREMNWVLRNVDTDYLVFMDDDVFVEGGWLEGMLRCIQDERVGVVAPLHKDKNGRLSFSGAYFSGDGLGTHEHTFDRPSEPRETFMYCSACILIDMKKCGHVFMDERYKKFFFDLVHGLEVWEAGFRPVCTPESVVTHLGGATIKWGSANSNELLKKDRALFVQQWVESGRLAKLEQGVWQQHSYLRFLLDIPRRIEDFFRKVDSLDLDQLERGILDLIAAARNYDLYKQIIAKHWFEKISVWRARKEVQKETILKEITGKMKEWVREEIWIPGEKGKKTPVLSALVSAGQSERFLRKLLEDLESQTIADRMEIIIVDNHSPQNEGAIVRDFQKRHENIVYLRTSERENSSACFNRCIQLSRGKYLTLANPEDRHRNDGLEKLVNLLEARPDYALAYADLGITDRENEPFENARVCGYCRWPDFDPRLLFQISYVGPQPVWRREIHDRYGYFDPEFWSAGDYEFWLRIAQKEKFIHVPEVLGLYFSSPDRNDHDHKASSYLECEKARERHWSPDWGNRPKPFLNQNPFFVAQPDLNHPIIKKFLQLKQQGVDFYRKGDRMRAETALKIALKMVPQDPDVLVSLGRICYDTERDTEALQYLKTALQVNSRDSAAWAGVALVTLRLKDGKSFVKARQQLLALDPRHPLLPSLEKVAIKDGDGFSPKSETKNTPLGMSGALRP